MDILSMIFSDLVREESFINIDMDVKGWMENNFMKTRKLTFFSMILLESIGQGCFINIDLYVNTCTFLCLLTESTALIFRETL